MECGNSTDAKLKLENLRVKVTRNEAEKGFTGHEWNMKMKLTSKWKHTSECPAFYSVKQVDSVMHAGLYFIK